LNFKKFILSSILFLSFSSFVSASDLQDFELTDEFTEARKILATMYTQQQQIETEIVKMSTSFFSDANQVKLFKYFKKPECHQYSETTYFSLYPDQNYSFHNEVNDDGEVKSTNRRGNLSEEKHNPLIFSNAEVRPSFSYTK
jgi:hypothetical protein